jgi:dynein heavy chain
LKSDLDSKYTVIFHNYGLDLEAVQRLYEKQKASPPLLRNAPPVTGNILWAKQLLRRIEEPMRRFKGHSSLMTNSKEAKKIVRTYNKVARALVEFETLWQSAWTKSIEAARSGLQATLIIRHPVTDNLFVNFDREILQLIRETKCLQRVKVEVPDSAHMVLVHEEKYKSYYNQLLFALQEYERIIHMIVPLMQPLLEAHLKDLEHKIQPGRVLLTWQSMNIDGYLQRMHSGLSKFEELMKRVNDILDHRIEGNLRTISKTLLVDLPSNESFTLEQFVTLQEKTTKLKTALIESKNEEIEHAVGDVILAITTYSLEIAETVPKDAIQSFWEHYSRLIYVSVMRCTKESFFALKKRLGSKTSGGFLYMERPFFDVDIELSLPLVTMNPSLDEIQAAINRCALNILRCSKHILQWPKQPPREDSNRLHRNPFHHEIAKDYKIVAVCLMLTGAVEGIKKQVHDYLHTFIRYDFLWKEDKQMMYESFLKHSKTIDDFEAEVQRYVEIENLIGQISPVHNIGSLSLETGPLKHALRHEAAQWKRVSKCDCLKNFKHKLQACCVKNVVVLTFWFTPALYWQDS